MKVLDILTVFKEFLRAEDDFQKISSWVTSYKGKHWFRAVQFRLNSRNVNSRDDQTLYTLNYCQTLSYHKETSCIMNINIEWKLKNIREGLKNGHHYEWNFVNKIGIQIWEFRFWPPPSSLKYPKLKVCRNWVSEVTTSLLLG